MHLPRLLAALVALGVALATSLPAHAGPAPDARPQGMPPAPPTGWTTDLGVGAIVNPERQGGDEYQVRPIPFFDVRYRDERGVKLFANVPQGIGGYVYRNGDRRSRTAVSLAIAPGFATRDDDIQGLPEIDIATEARLGFEFTRGAWMASAQLGADLGTGHEGAWVDLALQRQGRLGRRGFWSLGPTLRIADEDYADSQYGISAAEAVASGLPAHDAGSGAEQLSIGGVVSMPIGEKWRWTAAGRVGRILGDRGDSPVVDERTQGFLLFAVSRPVGR